MGQSWVNGIDRLKRSSVPEILDIIAVMALVASWRGDWHTPVVHESLHHHLYASHAGIHCRFQTGHAGVDSGIEVGQTHIHCRLEPGYTSLQGHIGQATVALAALHRVDAWEEASGGHAIAIDKRS